ncbi:hypothetical protein B0H17DRAFT_1201433 [Mycena rosella]|uniref:Uncharacterized protein n=1 Tax=Mycena rosella TaxID=1033263 RepID=A0AAD7DGJ8_MYCRO|nr:hypothetical protein B0H17DRAFT_1201433 [Mycena rosella]
MPQPDAIATPLIPLPAPPSFTRLLARGPQHKNTRPISIASEYGTRTVPSIPPVAVPSLSQAHAHRPIRRGLVPYTADPIAAYRVGHAHRPPLPLMYASLPRLASIRIYISAPPSRPGHCRSQRRAPRFAPHLHLHLHIRAPNAWPASGYGTPPTVRRSIFAPVDAGGGELRAAPPFVSLAH